LLFVLRYLGGMKVSFLPKSFHEHIYIYIFVDIVRKYCIDVWILYFWHSNLFYYFTKSYHCCHVDPKQMKTPNKK